ncbi:protein of unknown function (plasmid) [Pararobbsia alpina]
MPMSENELRWLALERDLSDEAQTAVRAATLGTCGVAYALVGGHAMLAECDDSVLALRAAVVRFVLEVRARIVSPCPDIPTSVPTREPEKPPRRDVCN